MPDGSLTPVQHELLEAVWAAGPAGASVADLWRHAARTRRVSRTTVLNLVDRLARRGWLARIPDSSPVRYRATCTPEQTQARLAGDFVDGFFGGSAANLVSSLLGHQKLSRDDVTRLRALLDQATPPSRRKAP